MGKEGYAAQDTDFSAILAKVSEAKPDVVYLPDYYNVVNLVTAQAKEKGITAPFMGGDGWDSPDLNKAAAAGGYFTTHYSEQDTRPIVAAFVRAYGEKYKDDTGAANVPDALATLAYDATNLLLSAIEKAGDDDATKVAAAMAASSFDAVSGRITFDPQHNPIKSAVMLQVQPDKIVWVDTVAPESYADVCSGTGDPCRPLSVEPDRGRSRSVCCGDVGLARSCSFRFWRTPPGRSAGRLGGGQQASGHDAAGKKP